MFSHVCFCLLVSCCHENEDELAKREKTLDDSQGNICWFKFDESTWESTRVAESASEFQAKREREFELSTITFILVWPGLEGAMWRYFLLYASLYYFFTSSKLKHVNEINSKMEFHLHNKQRWFEALFTTCFIKIDLNLTENVGPSFFKLIFFVSILSNLHWGFLVFVLCFSMVLNHYLVVSIYSRTSINGHLP